MPALASAPPTGSALLGLYCVAAGQAALTVGAWVNARWLVIVAMALMAGGWLLAGGLQRKPQKHEARRGAGLRRPQAERFTASPALR